MTAYDVARRAISARPYLADEGGGFGPSLGRAVQVDPINPTLKAPGTECLKLKCDEPLSMFAFNFKLLRLAPLHLVRDDGEVRARCLHAMSAVDMLMPCAVGDYTARCAEP